MILFLNLLTVVIRHEGEVTKAVLQLPRLTAIGVLLDLKRQLLRLGHLATLCHGGHIQVLIDLTVKLLHLLAGLLQLVGLIPRRVHDTLQLRDLLLGIGLLILLASKNLRDAPDSLEDPSGGLLLIGQVHLSVVDRIDETAGGMKAEAVILPGVHARLLIIFQLRGHLQRPLHAVSGNSQHSHIAVHLALSASLEVVSYRILLRLIQNDALQLRVIAHLQGKHTTVGGQKPEDILTLRGAKGLTHHLLHQSLVGLETLDITLILRNIAAGGFEVILRDREILEISLAKRLQAKDALLQLRTFQQVGIATGDGDVLGERHTVLFVLTALIELTLTQRAGLQLTDKVRLRL